MNTTPAFSAFHQSPSLRSMIEISSPSSNGNSSVLFPVYANTALAFTRGGHFSWKNGDTEEKLTGLHSFNVSLREKPGFSISNDGSVPPITSRLGRMRCQHQVLTKGLNTLSALTQTYIRVTSLTQIFHALPFIRIQRPDTIF